MGEDLKSLPAQKAFDTISGYHSKFEALLKPWHPMHSHKHFTLQQARALLPKLKRLLSVANDELDELSIKLESASEIYRKAESRLKETKAPSKEVSDLGELRVSRQEFQNAISNLSSLQKQYVDCLTLWLDKISETGVILRDLRSGLIDFPARQGNVEYYLCWRLGEKDIDYWHLVSCS